MTPSEDTEKSFLEHLQDLRNHLVRATLVILVFAIAAFVFKDFIFDTIILAPKFPDFITYKLMCLLADKTGIDELCIKNFDFTLQNIEISGQFTTHIWVSVVVGFVVGFPYLIWELWKFVKPALNEAEKRIATRSIAIISLLFIVGVLFGYFVITPFSVNFLGTYQVSKEVVNQIALSSFISVVTTSSLLTGILFELPVIAYILARVGLITSRFMRKYRRHAIVVVFIVAAIITPSTDMVSQTLVALPLIVLYEVSIFIVSRVTRKNTFAG